MLRVRELPSVLGEALRCAVDDNCFILAKAAAYSAALALFPGLLTLTELLLRGRAERALEDLADSMGHVLPPVAQRLLIEYLAVSEDRSTLVLTVAAIGAVVFAADIMSSLTEGFRAAYRAPRRSSLWVDYAVSVALVFLAFLPLSAASAGLILSRQIEAAAARSLSQGSWIVEWSRLAWWVVALSAFTALLALLYHLAPNRKQRWRNVLPGAALGAALLAPVTGAFAFYVQRIARYTVFYGNVSTVVILLIWTYLVSLIVLYGCEFNAARERRLGTLAPRRRGDPASAGG